MGFLVTEEGFPERVRRAAAVVAAAKPRARARHDAGRFRNESDRRLPSELCFPSPLTVDFDFSVEMDTVAFTFAVGSQSLESRKSAT